jgi:hypothetical protein
MKRQTMRLSFSARRRTAALVLGLSLAAGLAQLPVNARSVSEDFILPEPGGLVLHPIITSFSFSNQVTVSWWSPGGVSQLQRASRLAPGDWQTIGQTTTNATLTLAPDGDAGFLRLRTLPTFLSADECFFCHLDKYDAWSGTRHATAWETLANIGQSTNPSCLKCHTAGFGMNSGYQDRRTTSHLAGVQCENCHGPGGGHPAHPATTATQPIVSLSANACGGCHNGYHHPTFDEWKLSKHVKVVEDVAVGFLSTNATTSTSRMMACGPCHSGAVRVAMLAGVENGEPPVLPTGPDAAAVGVTCVVCHDPHQDTDNGSQLRNPTFSLAPFSYRTSTNTTFAAQYKPEVNVCGQCHNMRGATWQDTSRYPHYSPQYNVLIGSGGFEGDTEPVQSEHRNNPKQCADCHTHRHTPDNLSPDNPVRTGHDFQVTLDACAKCHEDGETRKDLMELIQGFTDRRLAAIKGLLDNWATTKAPQALRDKYGPRAWEYTTPGALSNPPGVPAVSGPTAQEQAQVPDRIKQARFNLYLVFQDKSRGIHNFGYARHLLKVATDNVNAELAN